MDLRISHLACLGRLIGIRTVRGEPLHLVKFGWRMDIRVGCILRRPCLFSDSTGIDKLMCPGFV